MGIGLRLRQLRENANMTQEEVGALIGVTKATVNRYETEEIDIKRTIAIKLGKVLNVSPSYIMGWEDDDKPNIKSINNNMNLSEQEKKLIEYYRKLNDDGKKYIMQSTIVATKLYPEYPESQIAALGGGVKKVKPNASKERLQEIYNELKKK